VSKYQTPEFLALKEKWDRILKDDGFVDIEALDGGVEKAPLHKRSGFNSASASWHKSKADYFIYATYFLNEYAFETELERTVWEYHTNGISARNIAKLLKDVGMKTSRMTVWRTINYLRTRMKAKYLSGYDNE
jgi:hypothetical protein